MILLLLCWQQTCSISTTTQLFSFGNMHFVQSQRLLSAACACSMYYNRPQSHAGLKGVLTFCLTLRLLCCCCCRGQ
jgi:hypothetical protein